MNTPGPLPFEYHRVFDSLVDRLKGTPYLHKGRSPGRGLDCLGHIFWIHQRLGLPVYLPPEAANYPPDFWINGISHVYLQRLLDQFQVIPDRCAQKGDWWLFVGKPETAKVGHCGVILDSDTHSFQHAYRKRGMGTSRLRERFWSDRFYGTIRHREMDLLRDRVKEVPEVLKR